MRRRSITNTPTSGSTTPLTGPAGRRCPTVRRITVVGALLIVVVSLTRIRPPSGIVRPDESSSPGAGKVPPPPPPTATTTATSRERFVDEKPPFVQSLLNQNILGPFWNQRIHHHHNNTNMDAVVIAAGLDSTLAASVHNLYHLCGVRRFIFKRATYN